MPSELQVNLIKNQTGTKTFIDTVNETIDNIKLLPRAVTTAVNDAGTFTNREIVALVDGSGNATGEMRIHDGSTVGGKDISSGSLQLDTVTGAVDIPSNSNKLYFGNTTFSNTVTVAGEMIVMGGAANFTNTTNITGILYLG